MFAIRVPVLWWITAVFADGICLLFGMICANGWWNSRDATMPGAILAHETSAQLGGLSLSVFAILFLFVLLAGPTDPIGD